MPQSVRRLPRPLQVALVLLLATVPLIGVGPSFAWQTSPVSPATGHASVIAHGVTELPVSDVAWRVTYRTARPADDPLAAPAAPAVPAVPAAPAFLVGDSGRVLVAEPDGRLALLLAGEAVFAVEGAGASAPAVGGDRGAWFEIALPPATEAEEHGDGIAVFASAPFAAPGGEREIDIVRDVLTRDETTTVIGQETPVLLLVTGGTLRVEATDGSSATLRVGEAATFGGDVVVTGDSAAPASFVAALVGADLSSDDVGATPVVPQASPAAGSGPPGVGGPGTISATIYGCPPDSRPRQVSPDRCELNPEAADLELVALDSEPPRSLGAPVSQDGVLTWTGLPLGAYAVRAASFGEGFARILVPDGKAVRGEAVAGDRAETGYEIVLDESASEVGVEIYALVGRDPAAASSPFTETPPPHRAASPSPRRAVTSTPRPAATPLSRPAATPTPDKTSAVAMPRRGSIALRVWSCPDSLATFDAARCVLAPAPYDVAFAPEAGGAPLLLSGARAGAGGEWVWEDVAFGGYLVRQTLLAPGAATFYLPAGALLADNSGYRVALDAAAPTLSLDLYNLAPMPLAPLVAPTAVVLAPTAVVFPAAVAPTAVVLPPPAPLPIGATGGATNQAPALASAPTPAAAAPVDTDGDSLTDDVEIGVWGTDPTAFDTDGDGTSDGVEALGGGDPVSAAPPAAVPSAAAPPPTGGGADTDGDGLLDADETALGTGSGDPDSDDDGWLDGNEANLGTNPLDPGSLPQSP